MWIDNLINEFNKLVIVDNGAYSPQLKMEPPYTFTLSSGQYQPSGTTPPPIFGYKPVYLKLTLPKISGLDQPNQSYTTTYNSY
jgi:hypothetical protein